jgi:hypothetical protein
VRGGLTHGERTRQGQVLQDRPRCARQLAPGAVTAVKRQVDGAEKLDEPFGVRPFIGHATRVAANTSIVNPDGSRPAVPAHGRDGARTTLARQVPGLTKVSW